MKANKDNLIFALVGIIIGIFITAIGGVVLYKVVKNAGQPVRYEESEQKQKKKSPAKSAQKFNNFYLSFEKIADLSIFHTRGTLVEFSQTHATHGKHSLMVRIQPSSSYSGLMWEVYGSAVQNWTRAKDFHFDVYNNSEDNIKLEVKFKSGSNYPKKSFLLPVDLEPLKMNTIIIPIESIVESCDISQISYVSLFVQQPDKEITLYFDNLGIRQGTEADEKGDIRNDASAVSAAKHTAVLKKKEDIFVASSLDRIFQDGKTLVKPNFTQSANVQLAKNEYESFQIVVANGKNGLKDVRLEIKLTDEKIETSWRRVGYVLTKKPYYPVKFVGMWPDPLLSEGKVNIKPGITQPFWITVYASKDAAPGIYKGTIKVIAGDELLKEVPLSVKVANFTLPVESKLKTAFDFYGHKTSKHYPRKEKETDEMYSTRITELNEKYIIDMLQHRMNPILNIDPLSQKDLSRVDNYRRYGLNNFAIGKKGGTFENNWPSTNEEIEKYFPVYRRYGETLRFNNMLQYTYIYTWDEGKVGNPQVAKICSMIHKAHPDLKNMVCYHGFWDPQEDPEWGKDIDIWCFQIDKFNERKMQALKNRGMEIWMYVSGPGSSGSPNLAIDFDSIAYRIIPWLCWRYDIKGFLYWCVNWWPKVDPFISAMNTEWEQNGNGLMYYPGEDGPIESLRLDIFRDGMEDYEYLYLLDKRLGELRNKGLDSSSQDLVKNAEEFLNVKNSIAMSMTSFTKDTQIILERREKIAKAIEQLNKILGEN